MSKELPPQPRGYEQLTGLNTVKQLTVPKAANWAMIRCTGAGIRWRDDGINPTATTGYPLDPGEELIYDAVTGLPGLRFIQQEPTAEISVNYYGV